MNEGPHLCDGPYILSKSYSTQILSGSNVTSLSFSLGMIISTNSMSRIPLGDKLEEGYSLVSIEG